ncbi:MAG: hypothetical protein RL490_82 [Pseudomonadota bacterium]|jgi:ABC-type transport system substrate-binding protein
MRVWPGLALALLLAGCGDAAADRDRLRVTVVGDARRSASLARRLAAEQERPTLVTRDNAGQAIAGLASSWRFVDDGRSLILRLRPVPADVGKPLLAGDVVAAFRRAAARGEAALAATGIAGLAPPGKPQTRLQVLAPISRVVEIRLDRPSPFLLDWLAEPTLAITRRDMAGLAAYRGSGTAALHLLTRIADTPTPAARIGTIAIIGNSDPAAAIRDFLRNTDIIIGDGLDGLALARTTAPQPALRIDPLFGLYAYRFNTRVAALQDAGLRRALLRAIDRAALVRRYAVSALQPTDRLLPGQIVPLPRDTETDKAMLATLRAADAPMLRLTLLIPPGGDHRQIAEQVAAAWAPLGVQLAISVVDAAALDARVARGDYELALTEASIAMPDDLGWAGRYRCNRSYCNRNVDTLIDAAARATSERASLTAAVEAALQADPPMAPLFRPVRWALVAPRVEGWIPNTAGSHPLGRLQIASPG